MLVFVWRFLFVVLWGFFFLFVFCPLLYVSACIDCYNSWSELKIYYLFWICIATFLCIDSTLQCDKWDLRLYYNNVMLRLYIFLVYLYFMPWQEINHFYLQCCKPSTDRTDHDRRFVHVRWSTCIDFCLPIVSLPRHHTCVHKPTVNAYTHYTAIYFFPVQA